jgi:UDP-N-acetylmuramoylalanine--D-glutamate ligase
MSEKVLVYGVGIAGMATIRALMQRGIDFIAVDDHLSETQRRALADINVEAIELPDDDLLKKLIADSAFVAPAPGIAEHHRVIIESLRQGKEIKTELDLAYEWESGRSGGARPIVTVTGTDGKTSTVLLTQAMLAASGRRPIACGNTEIPMVEALDMDVDTFVVEATSFRLAFVESFRSQASAWLNLAPDHLDWHTSMETYEAAKARLWRNLSTTDTAIGFAGDATVMHHLRNVRARQIVVAEQSGDGDYFSREGKLFGPFGEITDTAAMRRSLPHDISNALVASALCHETGLGELSAMKAVLQTFIAPHHRIEFVVQAQGVSWFDDSKATTPHAALTALRGFDSVVLIAGGRNKGLDLSAMASEPERMKSVVAIGESADLIAQAFHGVCPVVFADSMNAAVSAVLSLATAGDTVLLSPGCTSLDWYGGYAERGDDFVRCVKEALESNVPRTQSNGVTS